MRKENSEDDVYKSDEVDTESKNSEEEEKNSDNELNDGSYKE